MNLIDENRNIGTNNKKIFMVGVIGIVLLLFIIIGLLAYVTTMSGNKITLMVDNKQYSASDYLLNKDNVLYIGVEDLTKLTKNNGYNYKSGSKDVEDDDKCYITNTYESTFFTVGSNQIYKVLEDTNETEYYTLESPIIKENGKIYIPISAVKVAVNTYYSNNNNKIIINSIATLEGSYNKQKSATFIPDSSIVWETTYSNKKLLKNKLVIVKDEEGLLGLASVSASNNSKTKVTTVSTKSIIDAKYKNIKYVERFNQLIVENENGKGIVQLEENNGSFSAKTVIAPQYEDIKQINEKLYLVSKTTQEKEKKYGVVSKLPDQEANQEPEEILPIIYEKIGIDISKFTNNNLSNEYIIYDSLIPVKKDNLWGFANLKGSIVIKTENSAIGYVSTSLSSNVLIIPEISGIVVKKENSYGIINKNGKVLIKDGLTRVYKETINGKEQYSMVYNNKKYNVIDYINNANNNVNKNATNNTTTNNTNNNTQNNSNTTQNANKTTTTNSNTTQNENKNTTTNSNTTQNENKNTTTNSNTTQNVNKNTTTN